MSAKPLKIVSIYVDDDIPAGAAGAAGADDDDALGIPPPPSEFMMLRMASAAEAVEAMAGLSFQLVLNREAVAEGGAAAGSAADAVADVTETEGRTGSDDDLPVSSKGA